MCKYAYYKEEDKYFPRLYCKTDDKFCIGAKRCNLQERYIPIEDYKFEECFKYVLEEQKHIPQGSYYIETYRKNKKGYLYLYIVIDDKLERIETELTEINQNYIYFDGKQVSLTPFDE